MKTTVFGSIFALVLTLGSLFSCTSQESSMTPFDLKVEYKTNPFTDVVNPRFSWILEDDRRGQSQTAYEILVASAPGVLEEGKGDVWASGKVKSPLMSQVEFEGSPLEKSTPYYWMVRAWDKEGAVGPWSEPAYFETGLLDASNWKASWIGYDLTHLGTGGRYHLPPVPYLRKEIELKGEVTKARLYATALGVFDFHINGQKVGEDYLNPGWTNYNIRLNYQAFDVTALLKEGDNALGAILSYGWYSGYLGYALLVGLPQVKEFYGKVPKLMAMLEVEYADGEKEVFGTNEEWKASSGPIIESDLLQGESYDARLEMEGWSRKGFDEEGWEAVSVFDAPDIQISLHPGEAIREIERIKPVEITPRPEGTIVNLGQNFAGIIELKVKGKAGEKVVLKYGEMLHPDGRLMTENLRMARATDTYILKGDPDGETWRPMFTFHGFQYVQISGYSGEVSDETIRGIALSSDHSTTASFQCGSEMINKLYSNINWTQLSNFLDLPTDCPQRDERLGWTGDAQVYMKSATLNRDVASFFTKWIRDLNDDQWETGAYPNFAPTPYIRPRYDFSPAWMEAGIICPYELWESYGDTRMIAEQWTNMEEFMDFCATRAGESNIFEEASFEDITPHAGFGDWLSLGKKTSPDLMATFYYAFSAKLMAEMAEAIGKSDRLEYYTQLLKDIKKDLFAHYGGPMDPFHCNGEAYVNADKYIDGELGFVGHTQTVYANAIYMGLLSPEEEEQAGKYLTALIDEAGGKVTAGFLGTKPMLPALSKMGYTAKAYDLFLRTEYPSWGFEIVNGASTIWERWNSYTHEEGFGGERNAGMNSFNHYAFGAVCEWMFENAAGIKAVEPAYRSVIIRPEVDERLGFLESEYESISGLISSEWKFEEEGLSMQVSIPVNVDATIYVPAGSVDQITEGGEEAKAAAGLQFLSMEEGYAVFKAGSGDYNFFVSR